MLIPLSLNDTATKEFLEWVADNYKDIFKHEDGSLFDPESWIDDFDRKLREDSAKREFEMNSHESVSGNPILFRFNDSDLVFEEA